MIGLVIYEFSCSFFLFYGREYCFWWDRWKEQIFSEKESVICVINENIMLRDKGLGCSFGRDYLFGDGR